MVTKRIIPCLDVKDGMVVKGVNFDGLAAVATPIELACRYNESGADELVFYDIAASVQGRKLFTDALKEVASNVFIPLTVGGGISTLGDFERVLGSGADKVSVNTGAIRNPALVGEAAKIFGSQCVVFSVDVKLIGGVYHIMTSAGKVDSGIEAIDWIKRGIDSGAGELVINSVDTDGVRQGFDLPLLAKVCEISSVPVIASGGAGSIEHFITLFETLPEVDAGLAASIFHYGEISIADLKAKLRDKGIPMRV